MNLAERLTAELGADVVDTSPPRLAACAVDGLAPAAVLTPGSRDLVCRAVTVAEELGAALLPRGNGTHLHIGNLPRRHDLTLSTRGLARVLKHDAADMTFTAEAGVTLAELEAVLRPAGQWLPLDPPRPEGVTLGGLLAADLNGSLRSSHGKVRDYLLGARAVIGGGKLVHGGGEVVKNVAGYDLPKLWIGSHGTLGVIVEATFKVRPLPAADVWLAAPMPTLSQAAAAAVALLEAPLAPYAVDFCDAAAAQQCGLPARPQVLVRLGGEVVEVRDQRDRLNRLLPGCDEIADTPARRDFSLGGDVSGRLSLLAGDVPAMLEAIESEARAFGAALCLLVHAGSGIVRLQIETPDSPLPFLRWLRFLARQRGGYLFIERLPEALKHEIDVWGESASPPQLHRRVKDALDPQGTFSPGRM